MVFVGFLSSLASAMFTKFGECVCLCCHFDGGKCQNTIKNRILNQFTSFVVQCVLLVISFFSVCDDACA